MKLAQELREKVNDAALTLEIKENIDNIVLKLRSRADSGKRSLELDLTKFHVATWGAIHKFFVDEGFRLNCYYGVDKATMRLSW